MQGTLLKRHKARCTDASTGATAPVTPSSFALGRPITLYGTTYMVTDADAFTRDWVKEKTGVDVPPAIATPTGARERVLWHAQRCLTLHMVHQH
jgi:DUF1126 PH-like domain